MKSAIIDKDLYLNKSISYIKNSRITEYDIKSAGFNIIREFKLLDEETIFKLSSMSKKKRTIEIGKMMGKNRDFNIRLTGLFKEVRKQFVEANNITDDDILSIKKDAIFVILKTPQVLKFGTFIEFVPKNVYTSYLYFNNMEFYYDGYHDKLEIKNFKFSIDADLMSAAGGEEFKFDLNTHPLINDLKTFMKISEKRSQKDLFKLLKIYRRKYIKRELPIDTYRNISDGAFELVNTGSKIKYASDDLKNEIDISENYVNFLMPFLSILL